MSKMRKSLPPYLPVTGVNYDSESLSVGEGDCLDILNFELHPHQIKTRPALSQVGEATAITQTEVLTAAEANALNTSEQALDFAPSSQYALILKITDSGGTTWTCTENLSTGKLVDQFGVDVAEVIRGTPSVYFTGYPWPKLAGGTQYNPYNPGGNTTFVYEYARLTNYIYPFLNDEYVSHMAIFQDPDAGAKLFAFTDRGIYLYDDSAGEASASFSLILDATVTAFSGITFWSTTQFTDATLGATMVAAGSIPTSAFDAQESDGNSRVFLYYDRSTSTFKELAPRYESSESFYTWTGGESLPLAMGTAVLPPIDYASVELWWLEGDDRWSITSDASGNLKDPDDNTCGSINLDTGAVSITAWPQSASIATSPYSSSAGVAVTLDYESEVYVRPRFVFNMNNRLIYVNTYDREWDTVGADWEATGTYRPWRVMWSDITDITKLDIVVNWTDNVGVDTSPYVAGEYIGDLLILYRRNSIEQMYFIGTIAVFGFRTSVNHGLFAGNTVGIYKDLHFYMGKDNVYVYDGNTSRSIGEDRVRDHLLSIAKTDSLDKFQSFVDNAKGEYWLLVATATDTFPTKAYIYSIDQDAWTVYEFPKGISAMQFRSEHFEKPLVATSDGYVMKLDDTIYADTWEEWDGDSWEDTTTAISVMLETREMVFGPIEDLDRVQRVMFEAASDADESRTITVNASFDYGSTYGASTEQSVALDSEYGERFYWIDHTNRKMRLKFTATVYVSLRYIQISGLGKEER